MEMNADIVYIMCHHLSPVRHHMIKELFFLESRRVELKGDVSFCNICFDSKHLFHIFW
jgi:hypothetical protein